MTNPPTAEKYILFQLQQMSPHNEHHRFEDICYRVARRRVSSNVKLASGPVSAGGDQGRDAESFLTWLPEQLPHAQGFIARASDKPVVVACTLQKDDLAGKVKEDVRKICEAATTDPVEYVLFCAANSIPTGKQHELQEWARTTHDVHLEIFDGLVLSKMLAEFDLVWVAQDYLELPSHMVPDYPGEDPAPQWYSDLLSRCRRDEVGTRTLGDLAQMRLGLRHATRELDARSDLPEWLGYMARFLHHELEASDEVTMRARYEIAVAHIRGLESLTAVEAAIRAFIRHAASSTSVSLLEDAQVLLMYAGGALGHGLDEGTRTLTFDELASLHADLTETVATLRATTDATTYPVRNARLLQLAALLALHPAYDRLAASSAGGGATETSAHVEAEDADSASSDAPLLADLDSDDEDLQPLPTGWLRAPDRALDLLGELIDLLPMVPTFEVETLAQQFDMLAPSLIDTPGYAKVRDGLDEAVNRLQGDAANAHKSRQRALALLKSGRPLDALHEFHIAKEKWWHGDTLRGSLLAMRMIASIYARMGMTLAAKQYRCSAASLALTNADGDAGEMGDLVADALVEAMDSSYQQGMWLDTAGLGRVAALARQALVADAFDYDKHGHVLKVLDFDMTTCIHAARSYWPNLENAVIAALGTTGWEEDVLEFVEATKTAWADRAQADFMTTADSQLSGTPFSDAGPTRTITFAALGTRWYVEVDNEHLAVLAAERFCAATQILLCELASLDPLLVPQDVRVKVRVGKPLGTEDRVRVEPSNDGLECTVFLTPFSDGLSKQSLDQETFAVLGRMLFSMSMRSSEDVLALIEQTAKSGLLNKLNVGRPYDEVAGLLDAAHYQACRAAAIAGRADKFVPIEVEELASPKGPGPGYDQVEAGVSVASRYERICDRYPLTLARVLGDARIRGLLERLRRDGWLDWHLLAAIASIATNYRATQLGYYGPKGIDQQGVMSLFNTKESAASIVVPLDAFDEDALAMALRVNAATVASGFGLSSPTQTPNLDATLEVLRTRYGYDSDDVPHLDLLGPDVIDEQGQFRQILLP